MKMCHGMAKLGNEVILVVANYKDTEKTDQDIHSFYGVTPIFKIVKFPWYKFKGSKYIYSYALALWALLQKPNLIFGRDLLPTIAAANFGLPCYYEFHIPPKFGTGIKGRLLQSFYQSRHLKKIIVISEVLKQLHLKAKIPSEKLLVAHDASDIPVLVPPIINKPNRNRIQIGYVGHLYPGKGMEIISKIAPKLLNIDFHIVGGHVADIEMWKEKCESNNIIFHGFVPQNKISSYLYSFDVCLLPNQKTVRILGGGDVDIGEYTSPLKMFDYMAHQRTIVASDLPVLREVLNDSNAILCNSDKPEDWIEAILLLEKNGYLRERLAQKAFNDFCEKYTWKIRAEIILSNHKY